MYSFNHKYTSEHPIFYRIFMNIAEYFVIILMKKRISELTCYVCSKKVYWFFFDRNKYPFYHCPKCLSLVREKEEIGKANGTYYIKGFSERMYKEIREECIEQNTTQDTSLGKRIS